MRTLLSAQHQLFSTMLLNLHRTAHLAFSDASASTANERAIKWVSLKPTLVSQELL
jgi:hypothetical protein